jgi:trehalose/maltose hydrolase-like predicted phosphorylase
VDKLRLNPDFPEELLGLHMHLRYRGQWLELDMNTERVRVEALSGVATPINLEVDGREFEIKEGQTIEIPLR